jgi:Domain amino terminal to FKBP-type peptidyl-prolyl isomerase/FKBP-type peptidyl-prolyl cis-trans isomerase
MCVVRCGPSFSRSNESSPSSRLRRSSGETRTQFVCTPFVCIITVITMTVIIYRTVLVALVTLFFLSSVHAGTNEAGLKFLRENQGQPGVISLASGLQYKILKKGKGPAHPTISAPCSCHYEGKLLDGTVFDSSYERGSPTTFAPNQVIKGECRTEAQRSVVVITVMVNVAQAFRCI